jgi:CheY-specific phosphatase CheX
MSLMSAMRLVTPFVHSTKKVMAQYFGQEIKMLKPSELKRGISHPDWEISAILNMSGVAEGMIAMSFSREVAQRLLEGIVDDARISTDVITDREAIEDTFREIVNIVSGNGKRELVDLDLRLSLPSVISGSLYSLHWHPKLKMVGVPFESDAGLFELAVGFTEIKEGL